MKCVVSYLSVAVYWMRVASSRPGFSAIASLSRMQKGWMGPLYSTVLRWNRPHNFMKSVDYWIQACYEDQIDTGNF
ncbi:hypothetical protein B0H19DRAFT_1153521 [Mycena capillaripes]|nr:hypothetical protein B0H19DRAFT_1153521 [Mycena capillaripes]